MDLGDRARTVAKQQCRSWTNPSMLCRTLLSFLPIVSWLPKYSVRDCLVADIVGGLTTGIMHVPQGIAYAVLSGVGPVYGLYTSFFPVLFYMFFGTSRHNSIGSFAVVALMSGVANDRISTEFRHSNGTLDMPYSPIEITATLTFALGLVQLLTAVLRLDFLMSYFSDQLVSGFATGAACHVFIAQVDDILGVAVPRSSGPGYIFTRIYDLVVRIPEANIAVIIISLFAIVFLYVGKEYVSIAAKKYLKTAIPIPFELILVVFATTFSYLFDFQRLYGIEIVDQIPSGLPMPQLPRFALVPTAITDAAGIAVVTIAVHVSMARMLAKRFSYTIDARQELFALGFTDILSGFFPVYPPSTALGRTMVNVSAGSKTLLSSLFSCLLLLAIILWLGPLLQALPMCILAAIILVSLKGMFEKFSELRTLWPVSKIDWVRREGFLRKISPKFQSIWLIAFIATVCIDVMRGLGIAILYALFTIILRLQWPEWSMNANIDDDIQKQNHHLCIYRFDAPLLFANIERFRSTIQRAVEERFDKEIAEKNCENFLIIDCTSFTFVDYMGVSALIETYVDINKMRVTVFFVSVRDSIMKMMLAAKMFNAVPQTAFFASIDDAITEANRIRSARLIGLSDLTREPGEMRPSNDSNLQNRPVMMHCYSNGVEC